jgi:ketosteroid isomerase-like protein
MKKRFAVAGLLVAASLPVTADVVVSVSSAEAAAALPTDQAQLREIVGALDRRMFDAYNAHDLDKLMAMFAPDLEFYHDTGGLVGYEQVKEGFRGIFANNTDIRRDLVAGSLEVYPIKGYGAIEIGQHRFCHTENGKDDCGTFKFLHVWRFAGGAWQASRIVSYGHWRRFDRQAAGSGCARGLDQNQPEKKNRNTFASKPYSSSAPGAPVLVRSRKSSYWNIMRSK